MYKSNIKAIKEALDERFDPKCSIKRIERLMSQLKMKHTDMRKSPNINEYQHGVIDGLGNAVAILEDEIKIQKKRPTHKPSKNNLITTKILDKNELPWENWWEPQDEKSA